MKEKISATQEMLDTNGEAMYFFGLIFMFVCGALVITAAFVLGGRCV